MMKKIDMSFWCAVSPIFLMEKCKGAYCVRAFDAHIFWGHVHVLHQFTMLILKKRLANAFLEVYQYNLAQIFPQKVEKTFETPKPTLGKVLRTYSNALWPLSKMDS